MKSGGLLVAAALLTSGCSFVFVHGPETNHASSGSRESDCTRSNAAPIVDTGLAGLIVANGLYAASLSAEERHTEALYGNGALAVVALAAGTLAIVSATYGYHETHRCRMIEGRTNPYAPPPLRPTRQERAADEAAEEAAVQQRLREQAAADAKAAGEAAGQAGAKRPAVQPASAVQPAKAK